MSSELEVRIAELERRIGAQEELLNGALDKQILRSPKTAPKATGGSPCDSCNNHGRYRCYDAPLECPRFWRWANGGRE